MGKPLEGVQDRPSRSTSQKPSSTKSAEIWLDNTGAALTEPYRRKLAAVCYQHFRGTKEHRSQQSWSDHFSVGVSIVKKYVQQIKSGAVNGKEMMSEIVPVLGTGIIPVGHRSANGPPRSLSNSPASR